MDLSGVPVVDNHVHPWRDSTRTVTADRLAGSVSFSDDVVTSVRREFLPLSELEPLLKLFRATNLNAQHLLTELSRFLNVERDWAEVARARNAAAEADYANWTARLFRDVGLQWLLVDEGGAQPRITLEELRAIAPVNARRVARSDNFIRDLLAREDDWSRFLHGYQDALDAAVEDGARAFKSVIAYRTGLDI